MKYTYIILIVSSFPIAIATILFHIKFTAKFSFKNFMYTLEDNFYSKKEKNESHEYLDIMEEFEKVFGRYYDNASLGIAFYILVSIFITFITIVEIILLLLFQLCKCGCPCFKFCFSFFLPIHSLLNMIIYIYLAFSEKYKVNLENKDIYIFEDEFNKEIKKNLDFMKSRKIYLIVCSLFSFIGLGVQLAMVIINYIDEKKYRNNINNNFNNKISVQQQIPQRFDSAGNFHQNNNVNNNNNVE